MDEREAQAEAERLNEGHPERERFQWTALPAEQGTWAVVKTPRRKAVDPLKATTEARPEPSDPDDPRGPLRGVSGYG